MPALELARAAGSAFDRGAEARRRRTALAPRHCCSPSSAMTFACRLDVFQVNLSPSCGRRDTSTAVRTTIIGATST